MTSNWKKAARVIGGSIPVVGLVIDVAEIASNAMEKASSGSLEQLREVAARQEINMQFAQHQAKVAQELAIAKRIENACEVEIEEFYESNGKGGAGLGFNAESKTVNLGVNGESQRIAKRIYRFKAAPGSINEVHYQDPE